MGGLLRQLLQWIFGRTWQVYIEGRKAPYRSEYAKPVRRFLCGATTRGQNVAPFLARETSRTDYGPEFTLRYKRVFAPHRSSAALPTGYSSQQATAGPLEDVFPSNHAPTKMGFAYMGMSYQEAKKAPAGCASPGAIFALFTSLRFFFDSLAGALRKLGNVALQRPAEHSCRRIRRNPRSPVGCVAL